jgi:hypothetical protein
VTALPDAETGGILVAAPFALPLRNLLPTGFAAELERAYGVRPTFVTPFAVDAFEDSSGRRFQNVPVPADPPGPGDGGVPQLAGVTAADRALKSVHLTGFAIEYPDGSLQNLELSRRRNAQWAVARAVTAAAPRTSAARRALRAAYARYRPARASIAAAFDRIRPAVVVVTSPGHYWLDHWVLDEAVRRGVPTVCVVLSWDNLYSRGPLVRRPDRLLVWSREMRRQAVEVHQYPPERVGIVGPLQFVYYEARPSASEVSEMRARVGLGTTEPYLAYVCGARTSRYDVEDVTAMMRALRASAYAGLRVVVRPHPQGARAVYRELRALGVLLDESPDLTASDARPEAVDVQAIRHMAAFLAEARFAVSSWGTTALLEACVMDTPAVQLRWMDVVPHSVPAEVAKVRDFQRYLHMRAFDATGARPYCDAPETLAATLADLETRAEHFAARRRLAVEVITTVPLGGSVARAAAGLAPLLAGRQARTVADAGVTAGAASR